MNLTWLGVMLIPLGLLVFVVAPRKLVHLAVFFLGFSASSVLDFPSGSPLTPFQWFATLFMMHRVLLVLYHGSDRIPLGRDKTLPLLLLFAFIATTSMIMPVIIDGKLIVSSNQLRDLYAEPLRLTSGTITRPLPVIFGALFATFLALTTDSPAKIRSLVKVFVFSGAVIAAWGVFQFLCFNVLRIEYPDYLFNNAKLETARGFAQEFGDGETIKRLSSVAIEPSVLAKHLLTIVPLLIAAIWLKIPLFSPRRDRIILWLLVLVILLSTSTIGYVGAIATFLACTWIIGRYRAVKVKLFQWLLGIGCAILVVLLLLSSAEEALNAIILSKIDSYSAIERSLSVINSWEYFLKYPVLGVGWGVVTVNDLLVNLLVSTGVIGLVVFLTLVFYLASRSIKSLDLVNRSASGKFTTLHTIGVGLLAAFVVLILNGIMTGVEFYLGYFYFVVALLAATNTAMRRQLTGTTRARIAAIAA